MALMFAICSAQPNWIPRNPKLMFQTVRNRVGDALGDAFAEDVPVGAVRGAAAMS